MRHAGARAAGAALALILAAAPVARGAQAATAGRRAGGRNAHPIEKVIGLLQELREKVRLEGQEEELTYAKFDSWCTNSAKTLQKAVTEGKETIDALGSKVDAKTKEEAALTEQISMLGEEILKYETASTGADQARADANDLYKQADKNLEDTVKAFQDAIAALQDAKTATSSFAQAKLRALATLPAVVLGQLTDQQLSGLQDAVARAGATPTDQERADLMAKGNYSAHVKKYSFKSDNIVELLKELGASFEEQRVEATKAETNAANAYNLAKNARAAALEAAKTAKSGKETALGDCQTELASAKSSLVDEKADLAADTTKFEDTSRDCEMKRSEWQERSSIREREMKALAAGVEILAKVSGVRTEAPTNPVLPPSPLASGAPAPAFFFLQTDPKTKAVNLLRKEASRLHSASFQRFAEEVAANVGGPFDEVNNMIQKMIFRLMAEQTDEDDHKNWCDLELQKTNASKVGKEERIAELETKVEQVKGSVEALGDEIQDADDMVAKITKFIQEATEVRTEGQKENKEAIEDAKAAQAAIAQATAVIQEFYKQTGMVAKEAWEFMQRGAGGEPAALPDKPETWASGYTGVSDPKQQPEGIVTVLTQISSDFSQMQAETQAQEETDQKNYEEEVKSSDIEKARRRKESEMKAQEKGRLVGKIAELEKSMKHTREEHAAVEQYLKDLAPACLEGDSTYEDRKAARDQEVGALKEAQVILASAYDESAAAPAPAPAPAGAFLSRVRRAWPR